jgi:hypothetical protein
MIQSLRVICLEQRETIIKIAVVRREKKYCKQAGSWKIQNSSAFRKNTPEEAHPRIDGEVDAAGHSFNINMN